MRMRHLQAAHLFPFSGGRRPDERDSCKLKFLDLFFCGGRLPSENVTAASWIFLIFFAVAGSQLNLLDLSFAVAGSQAKM